MTLNLGIHHWVIKYYQNFSNDDPGVEFDLFYGKVKFGPLCFCMGKRYNSGFFRNYTFVYDLEPAADDRSDKTFLLTSKLCPLGSVCPLPRGYLQVLNHEQNCIKSDFKEVSLKLATNGFCDKGFLLTAHSFLIESSKLLVTNTDIKARSILIWG